MLRQEFYNQMFDFISLYKCLVFMIISLQNSIMNNTRQMNSPSTKRTPHPNGDSAHERENASL